MMHKRTARDFTQHYKKSAGFTLIELLVVIAIIGILSAVVLASLNTARDKGNDAAVQADLAGVRTQAQLYYGDNSNTYGPTDSLDVLSGCDTAGTLFSDTTVQNQIAGADTANGTAVDDVVCNVSADGAEYAVSAALVAESDSYYCVDSAGAGVVTTTALGTATACTP